MFKNLIRKLALKTGRGQSLYVRFCRPSSLEWGQYLAKWGGLHHVGHSVSINRGAKFTDPAYVRIGNNVALSACTLLGHDGVIRILNNMYNKKLDSVGAIDIKDNSFVGEGAIVMPGTTIGPNSIVAAGSLVSRDVPPGMVVGGVPAKPICTIEELVQRIEDRCSAYPWIEMIRQREGAYDAAMEPQLREMRVKHFFGESAK